MTETDPDRLFRRALVSQGETFVASLRGLGELAGAESVLEAHRDDPDPVARLLAETVLTRDPAFDEAVRYLDDLQRAFARTVRGTPPMRSLVESLTLRFGARLTRFLALRLVQGADQGWRVTAALAYLERHRDPATTAPLIRFAAETESPGLQAVAAQIVAGFRDPDLVAKLDAERARLAAQGRRLPPALVGMTAPATGRVA